MTATGTATARQPGGYLRIATEEAWTPKELVDAYRGLLDTPGSVDAGFASLWGFIAGKSERARQLGVRLQDLDAVRIADMDAVGIAHQVIMLTPPGVQVFDAANGTEWARVCNDQLAEGIARHPTRLSGLAAVAPQAPAAAAAELERAVRQLGLKGVVVNSHTHGEYLDDPKYWEILEAAEALQVPLYLHPTTPSPDLIKPFLARGLEAGIYGFAVETGLHALRLIMSGALDRFPKLRIVLGHLGEGLPYFLQRMDYLHAINVRNGREAARALQRRPSEYLRENFWFSTSGMCWTPAVMFCVQVLGLDRVMYSMDYPYQYEAGEVSEMDALPISPEDKKRFFQTTAESVFGLR